MVATYFKTNINIIFDLLIANTNIYPQDSMCLFNVANKASSLALNRSLARFIPFAK